MKLRRIKYVVIGLAGVTVIGLGTAAYRADFKLGQNIELVVNMMRGIYLHYVDPVDPDTIGRNAAAGMVSSLDPYTELIHADEMSEFELMTTGKYGGIGSLIRQKGDRVQIAQPYKGSPADRAGLEIGDTFLEIDGKSAIGMTTSDVSGALKGEPGTEVNIKVQKFYTGEHQSLTVRREVIALPAVPYYGMAADSVGYIHHAEFTDGCADQMRAAIDDLRSQGAKSLILDYRGNGGGILQEAVKIVAMFVPKGTEVVSMRGREESANKTHRTETEPLDTLIPLVVLVDGYSASAAEIVAGALQDLDRAVLIGRRTYGKGLVQTTMPLGYNSWLKITTAKYYIPSGRCIQAIDYSHQSGEPEDAAGFEQAQNRPRLIPDSLIREFHTAAGRRVYDGGGVMPDLRLAPEYNSRFALVAYGKGYIDEFVDKWSLENRTREVTPRKFALTDADYASFVAFARDKDFGYESATSQTLEALRRNAEQERYMNDDIRAALDAVEAALKDDNETNLALHRDELSKIIENDIILRRHYAQGVSEHDLAYDKTVARAVEVLHNETEYREILTSRDTEKK